MPSPDREESQRLINVEISKLDADLVMERQLPIDELERLENYYTRLESMLLTMGPGFADALETIGERFNLLYEQMANARY